MWVNKHMQREDGSLDDPGLHALTEQGEPDRQSIRCAGNPICIEADPYYRREAK